MSPLRRRSEKQPSEKKQRRAATKTRQNPNNEATPTAAELEHSLNQLHDMLAHCNARIESLEQRVRELSENAEAAPSHADVMEVRLHSAKLAAELARATVELRGEIGMANNEARRAARMSRDLAENAKQTNNDDSQEFLGELDPSRSSDEENNSGNSSWSATA